MQPRMLMRHPSAPCTYVRAIGVRAGWVEEGRLTLRYRVEGDLDRLRMPPVPLASAHTEGLWQHTCFEAFVKQGDSRAYLELNFSPSSEWAIYGFDDYRHGMQPRKPCRPPEIMSLKQTATLLELDVAVHLEGLLTERPGPDCIRLGLGAVLEDRRGRLSYWALAHPSNRPDFHHPDSFVFSLPQRTVTA